MREAEAKRRGGGEVRGRQGGTGQERSEGAWEEVRGMRREGTGKDGRGGK